MKKRFYHASPRRFPVGTLLCAGGEVHMTEDELPHYTIFDKAYEEGWHVYEVEPQSKVVLDKMWDAWIARSAIVVRYVGKARGIIGHERWNAYVEKQQTDDPGNIPGSAAKRRWSKERFFGKIEI